MVHPNAPGRYLAGIECDGATYHRSATARDRDLLRERVLRGLGWRIHRVWSTDWWVDAERAAAALSDILASDLEADHQDVAEPDAVAVEEVDHSGWAPNADEAVTADKAAVPDAPEPGSEPDSERELGRRYAEREAEPSPGYSDGEPGVAGRIYELADLIKAGFRPERDAFYEMAYRPTLRRMAAYVITTEGPIFDDLLVRRVARIHGFGRAAGRIRDAILSTVEHRFPRTEEEGRQIFWPEGSGTEELPAFRPSSLDDRDHTDIPLVELAALARRFLDDGATAEETAVLVARELGLSRLREAARMRFLHAAHLAASS